jgi:hypothetical protein
MNMKKSEGIVVGPSQFLESIRKTRIEWLSNKSGIKCIDEGNLLDAARKIAIGGF